MLSAVDVTAGGLLAHPHHFDGAEIGDGESVVVAWKICDRDGGDGPRAGSVAKS